MESEDWKRIEELFHQAMELPTEQRPDFLARACGDNLPIRSEVESYLAAYHGKPELIEESVYGFGLRILSSTVPPLSLEGEQIGSFRIQRLLGEGGMGAVYLAEDTQLNRPVALKFLSTDLLMNIWARQQLKREAQAVARLEHPNICQVYGFEEEAGHSFIVMPFIQGETLYSLLQNGPIPYERLTPIAIQIASALAEAHANGIVHRDIKPKNIMVSAGDQVKVLDFGLAMSAPPIGSETTRTERRNASQRIAGGTVGYMSPEQVRREKLDNRTDIFSFGIVLYEMITGGNPFARENHADCESAVLSKDPLETAPRPARLSKIVRKCLNKRREQRYQSFNEVLLDLEELQAGKRIALRRPLFNRLRTRVALVTLLLLVIMAAIVYSALTRVRTLAVLPVINASGDQGVDYLASGLTDTVIQGLSRLPRLKVNPRTQVLMYKDSSRDTLKIGRALNVDFVFVAEIHKRDSHPMLESRLVRVADGAVLWNNERGLDSSGLLLAYTELCNAIAKQTVLFLREAERSRMFARQTLNPEAFRYYLEARYYWNNRTRDNIPKAIENYLKALTLDREYLQVFTGLADCFAIRTTVAWGSVRTSEAMGLAKDYALRALDKDNTIAEAHASLGIVKLRYDWDYVGAENEFKTAIDLDPGYSPAYLWYSRLLALTGRTEESIARSKLAWELDPLSTQTEVSIAIPYYYGRQYEQAADHLNKILEKRPGDRSATYVLSLTLLQQRAYDRVVALSLPFYSKDQTLFAVPLGVAYARNGQPDQCRKILAGLDALSQNDNYEGLLQEKAILHMALNEMDQAFGLLQKVCQNRFGPFTYIKVDPLFDDLRSDPRHHDLLRCAQLL